MRRLMAAAMLPVATLPVSAQQAMYENAPRIASYFTDDTGRARLTYWLGERAAESVFADVACDRFHHPEIEIHAPSSAALHWLGTNENNAGPLEGTLWLDQERTAVVLASVRYDFLIGDWVLAFTWMNANEEELGLLAEATQIGIATSGFVLDLSNAEGDPENRAAFVEACLAM